MKRITTSENRRVDATVFEGRIIIREELGFVPTGHSRKKWDGYSNSLTIAELREILKMAESEATK